VFTVREMEKEYRIGLNALRDAERRTSNVERRTEGAI